MKVLILNSFNKNNSHTELIQKYITDYFKKTNVSLEMLLLKDMKIIYCTGCFGCWLKTPGMCVANDDSNIILKKVINSDLVIFLTDISFGGYSSQLKKVVDKLIPNFMPFFKNINGEIHHAKRYKKYPSLIGIGVTDNNDIEIKETFKNIVQRNSINLYSPSHSSQVILLQNSGNEVINKIHEALRKVGVINEY